MTTTQHEVFDLIGVGFGPSNISLAIALAESGMLIHTRFLGARQGFAWHPGMMIPGADMQISFLTDLVSERNPKSPYTFGNYLHQKAPTGRFYQSQDILPEPGRIQRLSGVGRR